MVDYIRNNGVGLSTIKGRFPMENTDLCFQWNVPIIYIMFNFDSALHSEVNKQ